MGTRRRSRVVTLKVWWLFAAAYDFFFAGRATTAAGALLFIGFGVFMLWPSDYKP